MKIISKFKDYYDVSMGYGMDESLLFNRAQMILPCPMAFSDLVGDTSFGEHGWGAESPYYSIERRLIGFCGQLFPFVEITRDCEESAISEIRKLEDNCGKNSQEQKSAQKKIEIKTARRALANPRTFSTRVA
jgi:hypothetical protein